MTANSQQSKGLGEAWQCFPAGWDRARVQSASKDDIQKLKKALIDMSNRVKQRLLRSAAELEDIDTKMNSRWPVPMFIPGTYIPPATPDFIKLIQRLWPTGPWGILVYRSIGYSDAVGWSKEIQHRLEDLITRPFACCSHFESGAKEVASRFQLIYVEYEDFEAHAANPSAANWISRHYGRVSVPLYGDGFNHGFCLNITREVVESLQGRPETLPFIQVIEETSTDRAIERRIRAIKKQYYAQLHPLDRHLARDKKYTQSPLCFNVAVSQLLPGLFNAVVGELASDGLYELGCRMKGGEIWISETTTLMRERKERKVLARRSPERMK